MPSELAPELNALLMEVRDAPIGVAWHAAKSLAEIGDGTVLPFLWEALRDNWAEVGKVLARKKEGIVVDGGIDRIQVLEQVIISLTPIEECRELLDAEELFGAAFVERKAKGTSLDELWGHISS